MSPNIRESRVVSQTEGQIATMATPSRVGRIVASAVLFGNDVVQMKGVGLIVFMDTAILTSPARSLPDQISQCEIH